MCYTILLTTYFLIKLQSNHKCVKCNSQSSLLSNNNSSQPISSEMSNNNDGSSNLSTTSSTTSLSSTSTTLTDDVKARLEDVILGQGSARSELMRRKSNSY